MVPYEGLQLVDGLLVLAVGDGEFRETQRGGDLPLVGVQGEGVLLQARRGAVQHRAGPQGQQFREEPHLEGEVSAGPCVLGFCGQLAEAQQVQLVGADAQFVSRIPAHYGRRVRGRVAVLRQEGAQPRDIRMDQLVEGVRRRLAPQDVDDLRLRDTFVRVQGHQTEQALLHRGAGVEHAPAADRAERAEDLDHQQVVLAVRVLVQEGPGGGLVEQAGFLEDFGQALDGVPPRHADPAVLDLPQCPETDSGALGHHPLTQPGSVSRVPHHLPEIVGLVVQCALDRHQIPVRRRAAFPDTHSS